jgi:ABC-type polysaccharide transport system permease subunit
MKIKQPGALSRNPYWGRSIWQLYVLIIIPIALVFIFHYIPMGGILIAFKDYSFRRGIWGSAWVGFKYFRQFFNNPIFWDILKNTLVISVLSLVISFPFPILLALSFNEIRNYQIKKILQTITFAPHFISTVVAVSIIFQIFSYHYGVVNSVLNLLGLESVNFIGADTFFRPAYIWSGIWQGAGYGSILYFAALTGVDQNLYDAALIDGVNKFQRVRYIDLPSIAPIIVISLIMSVGNIMGVGFEKVYLMQNPMNYRISEVISTYVYKVGMLQSQYSFSTAVGLFNSAINCLLLVTVNMIARKVNETSLF